MSQAITAVQKSSLLILLNEVLSGKSPADFVLHRYFRENPKLGSRDRSLIAETLYGCLRRLHWLRSLGADTTQRLALAGFLKVQGYSVRDLSEHANAQDLEWLKNLKANPVVSDDLTVQTDLPQWVVDRLTSQMQPDALVALGRSLQQSAPLDLRVNTHLVNRDVAREALRQEGVESTPTPWSPLGLRVQGHPALSSLPSFKKGWVEVQDEGSQLLGLLLAPRRREMVVDFCAGAGGKTLLLSALMDNTGVVYAFDLSRRRLDNLKPRLKRSGLSNIHPVLITSERDDRVRRLWGKIDRVLVDAPCSGLGTLRRNPDLKLRQTPQSVAELTQIQASILAAAAQLVKPRGRLVYATCSLLAEENDLQAEAFSAAHPDFVVQNAGGILAAQGVEISTEERLHLLPSVHGTDGFFAAVWERKPLAKKAD
jgi:16S rRNA (cytosine967-C5)-methyltransferase